MKLKYEFDQTYSAISKRFITDSAYLKIIFNENKRLEIYKMNILSLIAFWAQKGFVVVWNYILLMNNPILIIFIERFV